MRKITFFTFLCLSFHLSLQSQSSYRAGFLPKLNINHKFKKGWKLNYKTESRFISSEGKIHGNRNHNFHYVLLDMSVLVSRKTGIGNSFAGGYLLRVNKNTNDHRLIQQFTIVNRHYTYRLAHRFAADQTFREGKSNVYRFRYRFGSEIPLDGHSLDKEEYYIKINNEYLNSFNAGRYDLEVRLSPVIGHIFSHSNKLELGLDYRINNFIHNNTKNSYWVVVNWFISI